MSEERHPRLRGHDPAAGADTHGQSWSGRSVTPAPFAGDDGGADPAVVAALAALAQAAAPARTDAERELCAALARGRLVVPLLAAPDPEGAPTSSAMATALLTGPDGSRALPAFSGVAALSAWDAAARPVPMTTQQACAAALEDGCTAMPIDLATEHAAVLRFSQLWALALGERWVPAHEDARVRLAVAEAAMGVDGLLGARAEDGSVHAPGTMRLVLTLRGGLPAAAVEAIAQRVGERLAADPDVRRRIDDLAVVIHQAIEPQDAPPLLADE